MKKLLLLLILVAGTASAQNEFDLIDGFTLEKVSGTFTVSSTTKKAFFRYGEGYFTIRNVTGPIELTVESPGMKPLTMTVTVPEEADRGYLILQPDDATLKKYKSQYDFYPVTEEKQDTVKPSAPVTEQPEPKKPEPPSEEPEKEAAPTEEPGSQQDMAPHPLSEVQDIDYIDEPAYYPGNAVNKFIASNLRYPQKAIDYNIQGKVIVRFVVSTTGDITNVRIVKSTNLPMDRECVRIVQSMPRWSPGKYKGKPVNSWFNLPISFKLQ